MDGVDVPARTIGNVEGDPAGPVTERAPICAPAVLADSETECPLDGSAGFVQAHRADPNAWMEDNRRAVRALAAATLRLPAARCDRSASRMIEIGILRGSGRASDGRA